MDAMEIKQEIEDLKTNGRTSYENCEKLVLLEKALKYLCEEGHGLRHEWEDLSQNGAACHALTWKEAETWVSGMKNSDGSHGQCWSMDQVQQVILSSP